jgi:phosphatidylserine decarboxylase
MTLAREGFREMLISTATLGVGGAFAVWAAAMGSPLWWALAIPLLALWIFTFAFFRDPHRDVPTTPGLLVAPADGRVTEVSRVESISGIDGPALRISIFLSVFDVHINRSPCAGRVEKTDYRKGEFLDARHPECGVRNEAMKVTLAPDPGIPGPVFVTQIAGLIARRIICRSKTGDRLSRGERFGLIKFGSRTELVLPWTDGVKPAVQVGDKVKGGETVMVTVDAPTSVSTSPARGAGVAVG